MIENMKLEYWGLTSPRLPKKEALDRPQDGFYDELRQSMKNHGLIQPITVCFVEDEDDYFLVCGRGRLLAAHELEWEGIDVITGKLKNLDEVNALRLQENEKRSSNIIADYLAIQPMINEKGYEAAAKVLCMRESQLKQLDHHFHLVPASVLVASIEGKVAVSTVKKIGKLESPLRKQVVKILEEKGKVTAKDLQELRSARKAEATKTLPAEFFETPVEHKTLFTIEQMKYVLTTALAHGETHTADLVKKLIGE